MASNDQHRDISKVARRRQTHVGDLQLAQGLSSPQTLKDEPLGLRLHFLAMVVYVFPVSVSPVLTVLLVLAALAILAALGQRSSGMPGLPRLPVVGSLPWMRGTTPPHRLFMKFGRK